MSSYVSLDVSTPCPSHVDLCRGEITTRTDWREQSFVKQQALFTFIFCNIFRRVMLHGTGGSQLLCKHSMTPSIKDIPAMESVRKCARILLKLHLHHECLDSTYWWKVCHLLWNTRTVAVWVVISLWMSVALALPSKNSRRVHRCTLTFPQHQELYSAALTAAIRYTTCYEWTSWRFSCRFRKLSWPYSLIEPSED
jgi:hypothetical protein